MKLFIRANAANYRRLIEDERNQGRLPLALITAGHIVGQGWAFLHPFTQQAMFPGKGRYGADKDSDQRHEPFLIVRLWRSWGTHQHRNHPNPTIGRFAYGLVWRRKWGFRPRWKLLDADIVRNDPCIAEDWGSGPYEDW